MNRSLILSFLFCLLFVFMGVSQKGPFEDDEIKSRYLRGSYTLDESSSGIAGSPYLDKSFQNGLLFFDGKDPLQASLRYDVVKEQMQVYLGSNNYSVIQDKIYVRIGNQDFKKLNYKDRDNNFLVGYFNVLNPAYENGKLLLLEKPSKKIREGQEAGAMRPATSSQYIDKSDLYLKFPNSNTAIVAEQNTKKFLALFNKEQREKLKKYMDENDLKVKKESDLKKIVDYYNSSILPNIS